MRSIPLLAHGKCPVLPGAVCFRLPRTDGTLFSSGHLTAMRCSKCRGQLEQSQDMRFIDRFMLMIVNDGLWYSSIPLEQLQVTVEPWSSLGTWCSSCCYHIVHDVYSGQSGSLDWVLKTLLGLAFHPGCPFSLSSAQEATSNEATSQRTWFRWWLRTSHGDK